MKTCPMCRIRYPDALEYCPQDGNALPGGAPGRTQYLYDRFVGTVIDGRYKIEAKLAEGGMGLVYAGRHVIIDKRVAIKVLKKDAHSDETAAQRFLTEARSASRIGHANIVDITDFGRLPDGSAYFVMEYLEGRSLGQELARGPLGAQRAIRIAAQMARGLQAAHKHDIVHRDLKPDNVFLIERDGQPDLVKIVDFGIAKVQTALGPQRLTAAGMVLGTPEYMSPEQATGKETDHRVDEYALGCILYEMLVGDVPFRGTNSAATLTMHAFEAPVPPRKRRPDLAIPARLEAVVLKMMAKKPADRYASMLDVLQALDGAGIETGSAAASGVRRFPRTTASAPTIRSALRATGLVTRLGAILGETGRRTATAVAIAVAAVALVGAVGYLSFGRPAAAPTRAAAQPVATPAIATPTPAPSPGNSSQAIFTLRSNPSGATVYIGDERIGVTPFELVRARGTEPVLFVFRMSGYKEQARTIIPDGNHDIEVALAHVVRERSRNPAPSMREAARPMSPSPKPPPKSLSDLRDPFN